jgi:hypothetical protein
MILIISLSFGNLIADREDAGGIIVEIGLADLIG